MSAARVNKAGERGVYTLAGHFWIDYHPHVAGALLLGRWPLMTGPASAHPHSGGPL